MILVSNPNYSVSDRDQCKKALLEQATRNGLKRAQILVDTSGGEVGTLVSAQQEVFQITAPNSTEASGCGVYDTTTINKVIKVVLSLEYGIE